ELQRVAVELAVTIATRLIHDKVQANDFAVEELVRKVVEQLEPKQPVTVRLHPEDKALLERRLAGQPLVPADAAEVPGVGDTAVPRGNCVAEAGPVSMQSQLEKQLSDIREHLLRNVGHGRT